MSIPAPYVELAQKAIKYYFQNEKVMPTPTDLPSEMTEQQAGVFVTIFNTKHSSNDKGLRGCIGTFLPVYKNIAEEIINNAVAAATQDYRFEPITEDELPELKYEVSILSEPEQVDSIKKLNAKKYGVIVEAGHSAVFEGNNKRGLLLPDLEGVDTVEQQIAIAAQKGGIDLKREKVKFFRFEIKKYV